MENGNYVWDKKRKNDYSDGLYWWSVNVWVLIWSWCEWRAFSTYIGDRKKVNPFVKQLKVFDVWVLELGRKKEHWNWNLEFGRNHNTKKANEIGVCEEARKPSSKEGAF